MANTELADRVLTAVATDAEIFQERIMGGISFFLRGNVMGSGTYIQEVHNNAHLAAY